MTAPKPLPPCQECGEQPKKMDLFGGYGWKCEQWDEYGGYRSHRIVAWGRTQAEADARWRRLAGGRK